MRPVLRQPPNVLGLLIVATAALVATLMTFGVFLPAFGQLGSTGRDPAALPERITVCDRDWTRDAIGRELTRDEIVARTEAEPIVVSTGPLPDCPPAVATGGEDGMATTVYVRTREDRYVGYSLVGEP